MLVGVRRVGKIAEAEHGGLGEITVFKKQTAGARVTDVKHHVHRNLGLRRTAVQGHFGRRSHESYKVYQVNVEPYVAVCCPRGVKS